MAAPATPAPTYVNNAGTSWPKPVDVGVQVRRAFDHGPWELGAEIERVRVAVARFLSLPPSGELVWTSGCTAALSIAIESLPWTEGDRVVTSSLEHHAVDGPVQRLVKSRAVVHEAAPYAPGSPFDLDWLREALEGGGVRLVTFSAASNVTGELLPAREIAALCRDYGAVSLMDAAQTVGVVPVDISELGVDIVCFAGHKGPLGPQGIGVLWTAEDVSYDCPSAICTVAEAREHQRNAPGYCDVGGINVAGVLGLGAGLAWLEEHPGAFDAPRAAARALAAELRARDGVTVYGGNGDSTTAVSFRLVSMDLIEAKGRFERHGIVLGAGTHCARSAIDTIGALDGTLRVSFGVFNDAADEANVLRAVDACLRDGR
jgi:selenocysteine lyase/cysteine desulfurase